METKRRFTLSRHAWDRLGERTRISGEELTALLQSKAYEVIHSQADRDWRSQDVALLAAFTGCSEKRLSKRFQTVLHMMVWSQADQGAVVAIVGRGVGPGTPRQVITVLSESEEGWRKHVSAEQIAAARAKAEAVLAGETLVDTLEVMFAWYDESGRRKIKTLPMRKVVGEEDVSHEEAVRAQLLELSPGCTDRYACVRTASNRADIRLEVRA